jgi:hypothetical protein
MRWKSGAEIEEKGARGCDCDQLTIAERIAEVTGALGDDIARCLSNPKLLVTQTIAIVRRVTERNPRTLGKNAVELFDRHLAAKPQTCGHRFQIRKLACLKTSLRNSDLDADSLMTHRRVVVPN